MSNARADRQKLHDPDQGNRLLSVLFLALLFLLTGASFWVAVSLGWWLRGWASNPARWTVVGLLCLLVFGYVYIAGLLLLRALIPKPREGLYPVKAVGPPPRDAVLYSLNTQLVRLRYQVPWSGGFLSALTILPPVSTVYRRLFGPRTRSAQFGDGAIFLDPYLVEIGARVHFGLGSKVTCHVFDKQFLTIKRVVIGDDVLIGADVWLLPGVRIGDHAVIALRSVVLPDTVIGPYEYWGGNPARKIGDVPRQGGD